MDPGMDIDGLDHKEPELVEDESQPMEGVTASEGVAVQNPLKGEYTWEIPNFSERPLKTFSDVFEIGGFSWQLLCFPKGNKPGQLSLFLAVPDIEEQPANWQRSASFKLSVLSALGPEHDATKETQHTFQGMENDWGFNNFISRVDLENPARGLINEDTVRVKVEIEVRVPEDFSYDSRKETGYVGLKNQGATCYMNSLLQTLYNINQFRKAVYGMPTSEDDEPSSSMPLALQSVFYKLQFTDGPVSTKDLTRSFGWDTNEAFQQHDVQELNRILCDRLEEKMKGTRVEGTINKLFEGHTLNYIDCINVDYKSTRRESFMDLQLDVKSCKNVYDSFDRYTEVETLEGENQYVAEGQGLQDARKGVLFEDFPAVLQLQLKRFEYDFMKDTMVKINDRYEFEEQLDLDAGGGKYLSANAPKGVRNKYRLLAVLVHSGGLHGGHYYAFVRPDGKQWLKFDDERVEVSTADKAVRDNYGGSAADDLPAGNPNLLNKNNGGLLGHAPARPPFARFANAYMLVYVRESDWDSVMCAVGKEDIPAHVCARLAAEQAEKERRRKEKAEAHLYTLVRIVTDADLAAQIGQTRFFDLVDHESPNVVSFKIAKKAPFSALQARVAERFVVPAERQRFWRWAPRQNGTYRPSMPLEIASPDAPVSSIRDGRRDSRPGTVTTINLLLENAVVWPGATPAALRGPGKQGKNDALLFFKQYDAVTGTLRYAGRAFVHRQSRIGELHELLRELGGLPADEPLDVYEEIKFEPSLMVDMKRSSLTLAQSELDDGDILVFQSTKVPETVPTGQRNVPEFFAAMRNRVRVVFKPLQEGGGEERRREDEEQQGVVLSEEKVSDNGTENADSTPPITSKHHHSDLPPGVFVLDLRKDMSYDEVSAAVAGRLGLDHPLKLAFRGQNPYSGLPHTAPLGYKASATLEDALRGGPRISAPPMTAVNASFENDTALASLPVLYYEVIDLPLPEYERLGTLQVAFHDSRGEEVAQQSVRLPRDAPVSDLLEALRALLPAGTIPNEEEEEQEIEPPLRLMEVYQWRIWQLFDPKEPVQHILDGAVWHLRAEVVPRDQRTLAEDPGALHVHVLQMSDDAQSRSMAIADPLIMCVREGETVAELGKRVQAVLGIPDEEFAKWKPVLCPPLAAPEPLEQGEVVTARIPRSDLQRLYGHHDRACIGWTHENKNPRKTHAHLNRSTGAWHGQERALRIRA